MFKPKEESSHEEADPDVAGRRPGGHGVLGACRGQGGHEQEADGGFPPDRRKPAVAHRRVRLVQERGDRKSTRLNSSHLVISYAVFCLKKKKKTKRESETMKNM